MEYGLIKDTTIQGIADSLRDKGIVPATRLEDYYIDCESFASNNVTSMTDPTPTTICIQDIIVNIPEAHSLEFVFTVGYVTNLEAEVMLGTIEVRKDGFKPFSKTIYNTITEKTFSASIDPYYGGGPLTVKINSGGAYGAGNCFGVIFDVYALDAEGNRMKLLKQRQIPNYVSPAGIVEAISNAPKTVPEEAFLLTGSLIYKFSNRQWGWFVNQYKDRITTEKITSLMNTFQAGNVGDDGDILDLPFVLNVEDITSMSSAFENQSRLKNIPVVRGTIKWGTNVDLRCAGNLFSVRDFENLFTDEMLKDFNTVKVTSSYSTPKPTNFSGARSLRSVPSWFYNFRLNEESTAWPSNTYQLYYNLFSQCFVLDEALNIPVWKCKAPLTSNVFSGTVDSCYRLKDFTFETIDGQPVVANWKGQTLNIQDQVGYNNGGAYYTGVILDYNSGITADKEVNNDEAYQALKNDPDYFATKIEYSRYNHESAVRTINSLPDTSAYLASAGGTNTIKFRGISGELTDAGAINTLTAEEIAVAAAKGWTVSIV